MTRLILASQSPRRRELLGLCGYPFDAISADVDESSVSDPDPAQDCIHTARLKAENVFEQIGTAQDERTIIVAADTIVALDGLILGKPRDKVSAEQMLRDLRDRLHDVHTGVVIIDANSGRVVMGNHKAVVKMRPYRDEEIAAYIASGDPMDKAGAYGIQHPIFKPVERLNGCYLGVMGLSICHLLHLFENVNLPMRADLAAIAYAHNGHDCHLYDNIAQKQGK